MQEAINMKFATFQGQSGIEWMMKPWNLSGPRQTMSSGRYRFHTKNQRLHLENEELSQQVDLEAELKWASTDVVGLTEEMKHCKQNVTE